MTAKAVHSKTLVIGGGGTAGHVLPSLRMADYIKDTYSEIVFIGGKNSIEESLCKEHGIRFMAVKTAKFDRSNKLRLPLVGLLNLLGVFQAYFLMRKLKPDAIFVSGGYASVPLVVAGKMLGIHPIVAHVCDLSLGLAHKLSLPFATHITSTFSSTAETLEKGHFVGPITNAFNLVKNTSTQKDKEKYTLLVYGGSLGAQAINEKLRASLTDILPKFEILHVCGTGNLDPTLNELEGYSQFEFVHDFPSLLAKADFAICRGGSNSLWELILAGIPHLAVPLPLGISRGDQIENCKHFASKGVTKYLEQEQFIVSDLRAELEDLVASGEEMRQNMIRLKPKQQAQEAIKQLLLA